MIAFQRLKHGFRRLSEAYNDLSTKFNAHTHSGVATGSGSTGGQNQVATTAVDAEFTLETLP